MNLTLELELIDINCDVGEGAENEAQLFPMISSCNIACGGHAGNASSMQRIVRLAKKWNVKVGAHPSYPDKDNFGRSSLKIPSEVLIQSIQKQIADLVYILKKEQLPLHHIKAHGALYNDIAKNDKLAEVFLGAVEEYKKNTLIYTPFASKIAEIAVAKSYSIAYEAFADRNYDDNLSLIARTHQKALITSPEAVLAHIVQMVRCQNLRTITGKIINIWADTFCIHSDTPSAFEIVLYLTQELPNYNIRIKK